MAIRIALADDHAIVLSGLERLFELEPDVRVVASCLTGEAALQAVRTHRPDVLVLDIRMPGKNGLAVARQIREERLPTRVVLLTAALGEDEAIEALRQRVRGVVLKEMAPHQLLRCVRQVAAGGQWIEKHSFGRALEKMVEREERPGPPAGLLTAREAEIVRLVSAGLRNKEIAERLSIGEGTVKVHVHHVYEKLGVDGRVALALVARDRGLA